jgi:hypothetical protein
VTKPEPDFPPAEKTIGRGDAPEPAATPPAVAEASPDATHAETTTTPDQAVASTDDVNTQTLDPGADGNEYLNGLMSNYRPTQNKVYADTINQMKDAMVNGTFDWQRCSQPITLDGDIIVDGHHRLISAEMAAAETGRPLMGTPDAIIPEGGIANGSAGNRVPNSWGGRDIGGIGVKDGTKPGEIPHRIDDAAHMKELEDLKDMSGPDD